MPCTSSHEGSACPACKRLLEDAVTAPCGHTFCGPCLPAPSPMGAQASSRALLCPLCTEKEKTEPRMVPVPLGPLAETCCEEHGEKIYFFCENDADFLCVLCREGPGHQAHSVGFLDEAIQPYRDRLRSRLEALSMERDEIENVKSREDQKLQVLLTQIGSKKRQVEAAFERLQQELGEQLCLVLARLSELEQQIWKEREEYLLKVTEEVTRLGAQVQELQEKCQQPASELVQDARLNQNRSEMKTFLSPVTISPHLARKIRDLNRKIVTLPEMMRTFSGNLVHHLETDSGAFTLDPQTASQSLELSEDRKSVRCKWQKQSLPDSPLHSEGLPTVQGSPGFCAGRPRWQVDVQLADGGCARLDCIPRGMPVALYYDAGRVDLLSAETQAPIVTFTASFSGEVFPWFAAWSQGSCRTLNR